MTFGALLILLQLRLGTATWLGARYDRLENVDKDDWLNGPVTNSLKAR